MIDSTALKREDVLGDIAKLIFNRLDSPRKKSQVPIKPIVVEFMGLHKAGKDSNLVEIDRWFKRRKFNMLIRQESAETQKIRAMSRTNPYVYEMGHFTYTFSNFIEALTSRDFHMIVLNRGFVDTLCWLEFHRRQGTISDDNFNAFRSFILGGPWLEGMDAVVCLTCSVETSLKREYGTTKNVIYGSRMNPESLTLMRDCVESVFGYLQENYPKLKLIKVVTDNSTVAETRDEIVSGILDSVKERMNMGEDEIISHSPSLLRELASDAKRQEVKFRDLVPLSLLLQNGWIPQAVSCETDTYLTPKNQPVLSNEECFHLRFYGNGTYYLLYKRSDSPTRFRVSVPVPQEMVADFFDVFDKVAVIEKRRETFIKNDIVLTRDTIDGLGHFTEMKAPVTTDIRDEAVRLGLGPDRMVPETYIRLFLKNQTKTESA